mgnify:FL=1
MKRGYTLVELAIVVAIAAAIAAVILPMAIQEIKKAKISTARDEVKQLTAAVAKFWSDTGKWPNRTDPTGDVNVYVLYTGADDGPDPDLIPDNWPIDDTGNTWLEAVLDGKALNISKFLIGNPFDFPKWGGPYLATAEEEISLDPWGHSYLIQVQERENGSLRAIFVISAGPDGIIQTPRLQPIGSFSVQGDDIALLIR